MGQGWVALSRKNIQAFHPWFSYVLDFLHPLLTFGPPHLFWYNPSLLHVSRWSLSDYPACPLIITLYPN